MLTGPGAEPELFTAEKLIDIEPMTEEDQSILHERSPEAFASSLMSSLMGEESEDEAFHDVRPEVKQLLLDYDISGIKNPGLRGPDSFSAADISFHATLGTPSTAQGDWRTLQMTVCSS